MMLAEPLTARLGAREPTMAAALAELNARDGRRIFETGCARTSDGWEGDGLSTVVFGKWATANDGWVVSVDVDPAAVENARRLTAGYIVRVILGNSLDVLTGWGSPIDLLYLDSFDYPYGDLLDAYGGREDIDAAKVALEALTEGEIVARHWQIINPSQWHCEAELVTAWPRLHPRSLVLIDDAGLPGGGKARLAKRLLAERGAVCLAEGYQTLWSLT